MGLSPPSQHHLGTIFKYLQPGVQGEDPGGTGRHCPKLEEVKEQHSERSGNAADKGFLDAAAVLFGSKGRKGEDHLGAL